MGTIIEKEKTSPFGALLIFILFTLLTVGAFWFAFTNGIVARHAIIENPKSLISPAPTPDVPIIR